MVFRFAFVLLLGATACTAPSPSASRNPESPAQTGQESTTPSNQEYYDPNFEPLPPKSSWVLDRMNGQELAEAEVRGETPTLSLEFPEGETTGKATGTGGCNRYNGSVTVKGNQISFGHLISTKMACQSQQIENAYLGILNYGFLNYTYSPSQLIIYREVRGRRTVLNYKPAR